MDVYCPKCAEPWDNDELHEQAAENGSTYAETARRFRVEGCAVFEWSTPCTPSSSTRAQLAAAAYDLLGEDMDGATAMLEDYAPFMHA